MEGLYIVFLIDSKYKTHDGKVFRSLSDARDYCQGVIQDHYADKIVIGMFTYDERGSEMLISTIETVGFPHDKKEAEQLMLFSHFKK